MLPIILEAVYFILFQEDVRAFKIAHSNCVLLTTVFKNPAAIVYWHEKMIMAPSRLRWRSLHHQSWFYLGHFSGSGPECGSSCRNSSRVYTVHIRRCGVTDHTLDICEGIARSASYHTGKIWLYCGVQEGDPAQNVLQGLDTLFNEVN